MIEESITLRIPVVVELRSGRTFEDRAKEIVKWEGEDHVVFKDHELTPALHLAMSSGGAARGYVRGEALASARRRRRRAPTR